MPDTKPTRAELAAERDRCPECGAELDHLGACCTVGCAVYEAATHGPIRYYVELPWARIPCATFRRAIDARAGQAWSRIVRADYVPCDEDDDGLNAMEREALELSGDAQDVLVAVIDGLAAQAA